MFSGNRVAIDGTGLRGIGGWNLGYCLVEKSVIFNVLFGINDVQTYVEVMGLCPTLGLLTLAMIIYVGGIHFCIVFDVLK